MISVDIPSQIPNTQQLLNRVFILTAGGIAGTLAIVIFYLVTTRLILQPVRVLQETAEKVSEGDLNIRSDINTGDEFEVLSHTFNTMLTNLKTSADQLRAVNKSLDLRLGQLAESNVALYESNRLKSEFLANVSHELRTPLNSILGFAELLKEVARSDSDPKVSRYIQNINTAGHNLLDLINDLLDLAKIEAGRMEVRSEPLSLVDLFEALTSVLKPLTESKNLTITPTVAPEVPIIETDPAKLQQILYNFLSNAIKFSPGGGKIELDARLDGAERIRVSVTDHGPGIDIAKHHIIFEKFRQLDGSVTREHSGSGLGLAISKELGSLLGGSIGLQSELGAGATFFVVLPLKNAATNADVRSKLVLT
jgi:signal transduction histidine kinase